jgi:peptidoglycan/xylan/chitin deacetylase (PgdA/CDA1 family)
MAIHDASDTPRPSPQPERLSLRAMAARFGSLAPAPLLGLALSYALTGRRLALCLHRVAEVTPVHATHPELFERPSTLDALIGLLLSTRRGPHQGWLALTFDDGYEDAVRYVASRAREFPGVEFLIFVCPEKAERRAGFRWDLAERALARGVPRERVYQELDAPFALSENARPELLALGDLDGYRLATVEALQEVARLPNVTLGNHTNLHAPATQLSLEVAREEYRRSTADFQRLFGPARHFAFPFGTPGVHFDHRHVALLRELGDPVLWTTEARAYAPTERAPKAVLPRVPVDGRLGSDSLAGLIAAHELNHRMKGMHLFSF